MNYSDNFTGKAILALKEAICVAEEMGHTYIGSEHLLMGLLEEGAMPQLRYSVHSTLQLSVFEA